MKHKALAQIRERPLRERAQVGPRILKDPQSVEFAWQTCALLKTLWQHKTLSAEQWERILTEAEEHRIYERIPPEHPYGSLDAMLIAEIGVDTHDSRAQVLAAIENAPDNAKSTRGPRESNCDNVTNRTITGGGNRRAYLAARLKRDYPDICARIAAGEFTSIRAAAIAAGIITPKTPLQQLQSWWTKATPADRSTFLEWCSHA